MPSKSAQITQPHPLHSVPQSNASTSLTDESNPTTATHEPSIAKIWMTPRIHHVALQTAHFDQAIKFYTELLGPDGEEVAPFEVDLSRDSAIRVMTAPPRRKPAAPAN